MIDGRHCTREDLDILLLETNKIIEELNKNEVSNFRHYLQFVARYDKDISEKIRREVRYCDFDFKLYGPIIMANIKELENNILVDIYEHNN